LLVAAALLPALATLEGCEAPPRPGPPLPVLDEPPLREHAEDVADYTLHATLDPAAHTVHGEGTIRWRNTSARPVQQLWLHLYLNAFRDDKSAFMRERVGGRGSGSPSAWGGIDVRKLSWESHEGGPVDLLPALELHRPGDEDATDARAPLPREVAPGETVVLAVAFDDRLPSIVERTGYRGSFHMVGQWFPKLARLEPDGTWAHFPFHHLAEFYADFGTYDVTLDVPEAFTLGATGPAVESRVAGGRRIERHVQADVHDFAWTAWDRWRRLRDRVGGVDVTVLYPPGFDAVARRDLEAVRFALPYESALYGRYPYDVLTVVHPQEDAVEAGGMEYPTLITTESPWLTPPAVLAPEIVTVHELGHQWFYGLVATNEAAWPFLDEGLNQFAETDAMGRWKGSGSALDLPGLRVSDAALQAAASATAVQDEPIAQPASAFATGASYARLVYSRTAALLETFARVHGREALARALGRYTRRYRFEHPGPEQLIGVFAETLGPRAAATLRAALFEKGWVDYLVDGVSPSSALIRRRGTLSFPVEVELTFEDGSTKRVPWDGDGDWKRFDAPPGGPSLAAAVVDPDDRVFVDGNLTNNHGSARRGGGALRSLERITYLAQLALQAAAP
jgi:hypothetical protein